MNRYRVKPDSRVRLKDYDPDDTGDYKKNDDGKRLQKKRLNGGLPDLANCRSGCMRMAAGRC